MEWIAGLAMAMAMVMQAGAMPASAASAGPATACPATPAALPPGLAGWSRRDVLTAGARTGGAAMLTIGRAADARLLPTAQVMYPMRPEKPGAAPGNGGLFAFEVPAAGRYRVALGSGAWVDVVAAGRAVASAAHGHGPDCSGVRKMVDFDLKPGRHVLQVSGNAAATLPLMVARLP